MMEKSRFEASITTQNFDKFDSHGRRISRTNWYSLLSIVSTLIVTIFFLWYLMFLSGEGISKEEFSMVGFVFGLWCIAFSIVATVTAFKKKK